ncbi:MAG: hypothetical protein F6K09_17655 [Merismopedia sp. SIO2A8]|nr:hypothetical protein [Merismopedia sp. SIO2A8]
MLCLAPKYLYYNRLHGSGAIAVIYSESKTIALSTKVEAIANYGENPSSWPTLFNLMNQDEPKRCNTSVLR